MFSEGIQTEDPTSLAAASLSSIPLEFRMKKSFPVCTASSGNRAGLLNAPADKHLGKFVQHIGRFKIRQNLHTACKAVRTDDPAYFKELHGGIIR